MLLDSDYTVRLVDFGYASLAGNIPEALSYLQRSTTRPGALRCIAPEQVDPEETFNQTPKTDIYSFGCVALQGSSLESDVRPMLTCLQVLSGKQPWSEVREDPAVVLRLAKGYKPGRPESRTLNDSHWSLIQHCWSPMEERPAAGTIIPTIKQFLGSCPWFPPLCDLLPHASRSGHADPGAESSLSLSQALTEGSSTHFTPLHYLHPDTSTSVEGVVLASKYEIKEEERKRKEEEVRLEEHREKAEKSIALLDNKQGSKRKKRKEKAEAEKEKVKEEKECAEREVKERRQQEALRREEAAGSTVHKPGATDTESPELVDRKVRSLLSKLTMERFDSISDQIIAWANKSENEKDGRTLIQVIRLVFEKATDEAAWSEMYARLCQKMMETISPEVQDDGIRNSEGKPIAGGQLFRMHLLKCCQEDFERGWFAREATAKASDDQAIKATGEKKGGESELYSDEHYAAQKAKRYGLIQFIGELFKLQMLTGRIMHKYVKKLLGNVENPEEEEIQSLCQLLRTVGQLLDVPKARARMDVYFTQMKELCKNVSPRTQFMLQVMAESRVSLALFLTCFRTIGCDRAP